MSKCYKLPEYVNDNKWVKCKIPMVINKRNKIVIETKIGYGRIVRGMPVFAQYDNVNDKYYADIFGFLCFTPFKSLNGIEWYVIKNKSSDSKKTFRRLREIFCFVNNKGGVVFLEEYQSVLSSLGTITSLTELRSRQ